jgi:hypothetical protein
VDTETTGLPLRVGFGRYYDPSDLEKYEYSRVVSLAFFNEDWQKEAVTRPNGFTVENSQYHGVTQEHAEKEGTTLSDFFGEETKQRVKSVTWL